MKTSLSFTLLLLVNFSAYSQLNLKNSEKDYLNKSIWHQVFYDFEGELTLPMVVPGIIGTGTFNYSNNGVFIKNILNEYDIFSVKDLNIREVTNSTNTSFINYIPKDSTLRLKAVHKNRLLYTYELSQTDTTLRVNFSVPSKNSGETIVFDKMGGLLTFDRFNGFQTINIVNLRVSDSISICSTSFSDNVNNLIEKHKFKNGLLLRKTTIKKSKENRKEWMTADVIYKYDSELKLISMQNLNRKGKATDSVNYFYTEDKLNFIIQQGSNKKKERLYMMLQQKT